MKTLVVQSLKKPAQRVVNDFSIQVATVNGSGSQSSNNVLMRSIFQMGVPVSGKNLFPSNIAGLPTWFTIRANKDSYTARKKEVDILVAMNSQTALEDVQSLQSGSVCISPSELKLELVRSDVKHYQVPFAELAGKVTDQPRLRKLVTNMIYVGVVADLLQIEQEEIEKCIQRQFEGKQKAVELNLTAVKIGRQWSSRNLSKGDPFVIERMGKTSGKIIIDGNAAAAIGAMFAGATVMTWYPITPSSSLCESLTDYLNKYRVDEKTGKATYAVIQAEDELAAIGIAVGAGWAGARSMTSTSGPGISLMAELTGYAYFTEIPVVIFDVQRVGPSTGMPTRTAQGDIISAHFLSHGDTRHILLIPGSVAECYEMAMQAFELAEQFQTPVFVMSDLDLGMNNWMSDPFDYPSSPIKRGKVLSVEALEKIGKFERYRDVDGDGIPYRTIPGTRHALAAYFTRGSGHNEKAGYTERPEDYENLMRRLQRKFDTAKKFIPQPIISSTIGNNTGVGRAGAAGTGGADVGVIAFGSSDVAVKESLDQLKEIGIEANYLRIRAIPFTPEIMDFVAAHKRVYVVEQNCEGQLCRLLRMEYPEPATKLKSVLHFNGLPIDARSITDEIVRLES